MIEAGTLSLPGHRDRHVLPRTRSCPYSRRLRGARDFRRSVETLRVHGHFPPREQKLVLEWMGLHAPELLENWELATQGQPLKRIAPLE